MAKIRKLGKYKLIGWREWVSLPELGIPAIKVKVDTGARTSALHATNIRFHKQADGTTLVSFSVPIASGKKQKVQAPLIEKRKVRSSLGHDSIRPVILAQIALGHEVWNTEVTLVNRDPMGFRMLLGRLALRGRFIVHPNRSFLLSESETE